MRNGKDQNGRTVLLVAGLCIALLLIAGCFWFLLLVGVGKVLGL